MGRLSERCGDVESGAAERPQLRQVIGAAESMAHPAHSEQESVSMTRSTKTTIRIDVNF